MKGQRGEKQKKKEAKQTPLFTIGLWYNRDGKGGKPLGLS